MYKVQAQPKPKSSRGRFVAARCIFWHKGERWMYYLLAMFVGFLVAVMLVINGGLTAVYGAWLATIIIHVVGLVAILIVYAFRPGPLIPKIRIPLYYFLGGALGVGTTLFNNMAFGVISLSSITGLGLLGQSLTSLIIDHFGIMGMEKRPFQKRKLIGFAFLAGGCLLIMLL